MTEQEIRILKDKLDNVYPKWGGVGERIAEYEYDDDVVIEEPTQNESLEECSKITAKDVNQMKDYIHLLLNKFDEQQNRINSLYNLLNGQSENIKALTDKVQLMELKDEIF